MSELTKALIKFHQELPTIKKDAKAQYGQYADLCGVLSSVTPVLSANGLALTQTFLEDSLVTTLRHISGEEISSVGKLVIAQGKNALHSWGASVTYSRRYHACSILGIVADMDTDGVVEEAKPSAAPTPSPTPAPAPQPVPQPVPASKADDAPINRDEYNMVLTLLRGVNEKSPEKLQAISAAFKTAFPKSAHLRMSEAITTQSHVAFIHEQL